ncbi:MAG: hypothetical protein OXG08_07640 [Gammaproteobacteria bacterium]|nr:hypothetical protein [Gammaproteobacteria bacterium]
MRSKDAVSPDQLAIIGQSSRLSTGLALHRMRPYPILAQLIDTLALGGANMFHWPLGFVIRMVVKSTTLCRTTRDHRRMRRTYKAA